MATYGRDAIRGINVHPGTDPVISPERHTLGQQKPTQQRILELPRSISTTNLETTSRCRSVIHNDWKANAPHGGTNYFATTPGFTLILPALNDYPSEFQKFVFNRIVAKDTQESMEQEFCLNWCPNVTKLVPLYTMGDGNCLLHAASLAMWGFQDRDLVLRKAISHAVNDDIRNNTLYARWRHNREMENQQEYGFQLEPHQWEQEWHMVRQQTSAVATSGRNLESLDEFHAFVLANVLRRPIIMYAVPKLHSHQTDGTLQKINFHGVYLPLLWAPDSCKKDPLPLAYHLGHFSALVVVESAQQYRDGNLLLPLSDYYSQQLPVRFILPVEDPNTMMMDYLDLVHAPIGGSPYFSRGSIVCARLTISDVPSYLKPLISGFIDACYEAYIDQQKQPPLEAPTNAVGQERPPCINNCGMFGDTATGLCSKCRQKAIGAAQAQEKAVFEEKTPQQPQGQFQQATYDLSHQPNVTVGEQPSAMSSGAIKCPRCSNPGHPLFLGMCRHCYSSSTKQQVPVENAQWSSPQGEQERDPVYEVLPNTSQKVQPSHMSQPPAVPLPRKSSGGPVERSQCRTPGCEFYGTRETRFYCSKCFESNMEDILKEVDGEVERKASTIPTQSRYPPSSGSRFEQPSVVPPLPSSSLPPPFKEPPKCYRCRDFFASDEYSGMCHGCFMKMTQAESQETAKQNEWGRTQTEPMYNPQLSPQFFQNNTQQNCISEHCDNLATENGYCESCNTANARANANLHNQNLPTMQSRQVKTSSHEYASPTRPVPKPRRKYVTQNQLYADSTLPSTSSGAPMGATAPVVNLAHSQADIAFLEHDLPKCFLCTGGTISVNNVVCEYHARLMQRVLPSQFPGDDEHVKPKSAIADQRTASPYEEPKSSRDHQFGQPIQSVGTHKPKSDLSFGVPLTSVQSMYDADPALAAVGDEHRFGVLPQTEAAPSENRHGFLPEQDIYPQATSSQQARSHKLNDFGSHPPSQAAVYDSRRVVESENIAAGVDNLMGGRAGNPPPKTLCATPGCSFKGYEELKRLCPDCYQEKYDKPVPPNFPLV